MESTRSWPNNKCSMMLPTQLHPPCGWHSGGLPCTPTTLSVWRVAASNRWRVGGLRFNPPLGWHVQESFIRWSYSTGVGKRGRLALILYESHLDNRSWTKHCACWTHSGKYLSEESCHGWRGTQQPSGTYLVGNIDLELDKCYKESDRDMFDNNE